jgi:hypothetical protein
MTIGICKMKLVKLTLFLGILIIFVSFVYANQKTNKFIKVRTRLKPTNFSRGSVTRLLSLVTVGAVMFF